MYWLTLHLTNLKSSCSPRDQKSNLVLDVYEKLTAEGIQVRVVNMPFWELFEQHSENYHDEVLPPDITTRVSIEAGVTLGWHKYMGGEEEIICIDHFGASAPGKKLLQEFGFTYENILIRVRSLLTRKKS